MLRNRTNLKLINTKKSKQHCQQDLACKQCCQCWIKYKKQYETRLKILEQQIKREKNQNAVVTNLNKELLKQLNKYKKIMKEHEDIEEIKQKIKESLQEEVRREVEVELLMKDQKIKGLIQKNEDLTKQVDLLRDLKQQLQEKLHRQVQDASRSSSQIQRLSLQKQQLQQNLAHTQQLLEQAQNRIQIIEEALNNKTDIISKFQKTCTDLENKLILQKTQSSNFEFDNKVLAATIRANENYMSQLTKNSEENYKNMMNLEKNNFGLKVMVAQMSDELCEGRVTEDYLKNRLAWTQSLASYNESKIELMKADLHLLKQNI